MCVDAERIAAVFSRPLMFDRLNDDRFPVDVNPFIMPEPPSSPEPNEPAFLWLRRADQWFLGGVLGVLTLLLGVHAARIQGWGFRSEPVQAVECVDPDVAFRVPDGILWTTFKGCELRIETEPAAVT